MGGGMFLAQIDINGYLLKIYSKHVKKNFTIHKVFGLSFNKLYKVLNRADKDLTLQLSIKLAVLYSLQELQQDFLPNLMFYYKTLVKYRFLDFRYGILTLPGSSYLYLT